MIYQNDNITSIEFYFISLARNINKIVDTYTAGGDMDKYRAIMIKTMLKNNKDKMNDYIITKLIDKQYITKRYEVKI